MKIEINFKKKSELKGKERGWRVIVFLRGGA